MGGVKVSFAKELHVRRALSQKRRVHCSGCRDGDIRRTIGYSNSCIPVYTKDTLDEKGQARDTKVHVTL